MCRNVLIEEKFNELEEYIETLPTKKGSLIEVLRRAQELFGYIPKEVQIFVGEKLGEPLSKIFQTVNFYSYFSTEPRGENIISVCLGSACFVRGAAKVLAELEKQLDIKVGETTADGKFTIDALRCVGACGLAPVISINEKVYSMVTVNDVEGILSEY